MFSLSSAPATATEKGSPMQGLVGVTGMSSDSELIELLMGVLTHDSGELP